MKSCCSAPADPEGPTPEVSEKTEPAPAPKSDRAIHNAILGGALILGVAIVAATAIATRGGPGELISAVSGQKQLVALEESVAPSEGIEIPVTWGDLGRQMMAAGVIDQGKFEGLYNGRGGMTADMQAMLTGSNNGRIRMTRENSGAILNLLWALGLGNKNEILEQGEMMDPRFTGGPGGFASTGGWTLAQGGPMDHYSMHEFVTLTEDQQSLVERVAQGIYRPCCGNSVYFPDCNHGMAMLGLLELLASQGVGEAEMYQYGLAVNAYWFPETYLTIAKYLGAQGLSWQDAAPKEILGYDFSSSTGYQNIAAQVEPVQSGGGGGCGV